MITTLPAFDSNKIPTIAIVQKQEKEPPKPVLYTIKQGDTLTSIAQSQNTTVERLFDKNTTISNPDIINVGETLVVPESDEKLADRPMPDKMEGVSLGTSTKINYPRSNGGNLYSRGYCTWFVKERRPDLPNNLGDAYAWYSNAIRDGLSVGTSPAVGAVGVAINYGHVVIITGVHGNKVDVIEMNYQGWNVVSTRTTLASEFRYIY